MLPKNVLYYGKEEALPEQVELRAGPLTMLYERGDLRYIRLGDQEILRRIYVAIRDRNWGTIAPRFSDIQITREADSFVIRYTVENRQGEIDFAWTGTIRGEPDGVVTFRMDGQARSTFWRNRIGFCVLHPASLAGRNVVVEHVDGSRETAPFPVDFVADQPVLPFADMRGIAHEVRPGVWAEVAFSGDIFEMEDQRNWTDASYKTFSTPLRLPYPVEIQAGTQICQTITVQVSSASTPGKVSRQIAHASAPEIPTLTILRGEAERPLPRLGLGAASHEQPLTEKEIARLRALNLDHLRVDLPLQAPDYRAALERAVSEARQLGIRLDVALLASDEPEEEMQRLRAVIDAVRPPVRAWLCYPARERFLGGSPVARVLRAARVSLESYNPSIPFCAGTNTDFIFLKRSVPPLEQTDGLSFAICPQVHAFDNASLVETLEVQGDAVRSARRMSQSRPVYISPVALKMRFNPYATAPAAPPAPGELPPQVDVRQMSLFGAGWTLGSIKYLAEAGASSITYYETSGWRGVMEQEQGAPEPTVFRSLPGGVFPLYHVMAGVGTFAGGSLIPVQSSQPLRVTGLLLKNGPRERLILASFAPVPQTVRIVGLDGPLSVLALDEHSCLQAAQSPEAFQAEKGRRMETRDGALELELNPYSIIRVDPA